MTASDPLTPTETIRAKVARAAWNCGEVTLARVAAEMGLTPRPDSPDPGRPSRRNLPDLDTILADADEEFS